MFSFLSYWLYESCDRFPVQVALWTLGQLVASTGYVVEPYRKYPTLLEVLLNFLKTEQNQGTRREVGSLSRFSLYQTCWENGESGDVCSINMLQRCWWDFCPFPFCPVAGNGRGVSVKRCFVVVRCCDECFPFLLPLFHRLSVCWGF